MIRTIAIIAIWAVLLGTAPLIAVGLMLGWVIFNTRAFR